MDADPNNLYTLVLEPSTPPSNSPVIYDDDFSTQGNWLEDWTTGFQRRIPQRALQHGPIEGGYNLWQWPLAEAIQDVADFTAAIDVIPLSDRGMAGLISATATMPFTT